MNLKQFIEDTKNADIEQKCYEHRFVILIFALILIDFLITLSIVEYAVQSPLYVEGAPFETPRIDVQQVKYGAMLKSLVLYGIAVGMAKRLTTMEQPADGSA